MKVDVSGRGLDSFAGHFVCHVVGPLLDAYGAGRGPEVNPANLDIEVKINGVEVDFMSFINHIERQMDRMVQEQAKEILDKRFVDLPPGLVEGLSDLESRLKQLIREKFPLAKVEEDDY